MSSLSKICKISSMALMKSSNLRLIREEEKMMNTIPILILESARKMGVRACLALKIIYMKHIEVKKSKISAVIGPF